VAAKQGKARPWCGELDKSNVLNDALLKMAM